jgi:DNA-binding HxlR family transcriptional regulator
LQSRSRTRRQRVRGAVPAAPRLPESIDPGCAGCALLAQKWTPQIVAVLLGGPLRFTALQGCLAGVSDKVLSRRLVELEHQGLVTRTQYQEIPPRVEYELTEAGHALRPAVEEMDRWSRAYRPRSDGDSCCDAS